jgi:hypothetical protein
MLAPTNSELPWGDGRVTSGLRVVFHKGKVVVRGREGMINGDSYHLILNQSTYSNFGTVDRLRHSLTELYNMPVCFSHISARNEHAVYPEYPSEQCAGDPGYARPFRGNHYTLARRPAIHIHLRAAMQPLSSATLRVPNPPPPLRTQITVVRYRRRGEERGSLALVSCAARSS